MNPKPKVKAGRGWSGRLADGYAYTSAALCAAMGLLMLYGSSGVGPRIRQLLASPDAVLGISNHSLLILAGMIHLALSFFLVVKRDPASCGAMTAWAGFNCLVYRMGMAWMGVAPPFPAVRAIAQNVRVAPETLNLAWWCVTLFFLTGAGVILAGTWRRWRHAKSRAFLEHWREYRETTSLRETTTRVDKSALVGKMAIQPGGPGGGHVRPTSEATKGEFKFTCPSCGQHIRCENAYAGQEVICPGCKKSVTLHQPETLKMSCRFCQGHIEFPAYAVGQKIKCPHCAKSIILLHPA